MKRRKQSTLLLLVLTIFLSLFFFSTAFAGANTDYNGEISNIIKDSKGSVTAVEVSYPELSKIDDNGYETYVIKATRIPRALFQDYGYCSGCKVGDEILFTMRDGNPVSVSSTGWEEGANGFKTGGEGKIWETKYVYNRLFKVYCKADQAVACWSSRVFSFSQMAILLLSVGAFIIAGILYMTSMGDPKRIGQAKKIMTGALSAVGVIVLGRFFLTKVVGVYIPWF